MDVELKDALDRITCAIESLREIEVQKIRAKADRQSNKELLDWFSLVPESKGFLAKAQGEPVQIYRKYQGNTGPVTIRLWYVHVFLEIRDCRNFLLELQYHRSRYPNGEISFRCGHEPYIGSTDG
jgi:hypothetical protein